MQITISRGPEGARTATGHVVIIDVIRAFTTAAYAFAAGIEDIELVATIEEALSRPGFRMGEVGGRLVPGFDHNNSPNWLMGRRLSGLAVQRTGSGTQGVILANQTQTLWLGSLVVASATARALQSKDEVTLVAMNTYTEGPEDEDLAAALYLEALLRGKPPPTERVLAMVRDSRDAELLAPNDPDKPIEDPGCCTAIDAFDFAMRVDRQNGHLIAKPWQ
jgi:2-phosphosulfolactate phosphatase